MEEEELTLWISIEMRQLNPFTRYRSCYACMENLFRIIEDSFIFYGFANVDERLSALFYACFQRSSPGVKYQVHNENRQRRKSVLKSSLIFTIAIVFSTVLILRNHAELGEPHLFWAQIYADIIAATETSININEPNIKEKVEEDILDEFESVEEREEVLKEVDRQITLLKSQYEEVVKNKTELDEFAKGGKKGTLTLEKEKEQNLPTVKEKIQEDLGFNVAWSPVNEKVYHQMVQLKKVMKMDTIEAKSWFYIIRREELQLKKAQEILYSSDPNAIEEEPELKFDKELIGFALSERGA